MRKLLKILFLVGLLVPGLVLAAFDDVTLTTDVTVTANGVSLSVSGSSATIESIVVGSGSFDVTLASGSAIEVSSSNRNVINVSHTTYLVTNSCVNNESRIRLENSGTTATITITPTTDTCTGFANSTGGSGGGGPAPQCEDSIDNDGDGLIDSKDPGCENAADQDESNTVAPPPAATTTPTTATVAVVTPDESTLPPTVQVAAAATSQEVLDLANTLRSLIVKLKSLGGTVPSGLEQMVDSLGPALSVTFTRDLRVGMTGDDIKALQVWLNTHGFVIATNGSGSAGNETTYFGPATRAALIKFQQANGITPAAGYFGPKTRALISSQ